jgi:hypothetical protein
MPSPPSRRRARRRGSLLFQGKPSEKKPRPSDLACWRRNSCICVTVTADRLDRNATSPERIKTPITMIERGAGLGAIETDAETDQFETHTCHRTLLSGLLADPWPLECHVIATLWARPGGN